MPSFSQEQRLAIAIGIPTLALLFFLWYRRRQNFDDDDDDDEQESAVATVFETKFEVKIPQYLVGTVIGHAGANIKQIQKESGAYLRFKDDEDEEETMEDFDQSKPVSETEKTRTMIIKGEREKARKAEFLIKKIINDQPKIFTVEHFIPQKSCGRIIGRGGMTIRHLCKVSGARITISREDLHPDEPRKCIINGTTEQIANAKGLLDEKVAEHEQSMARRPAHQVSRYQGKEFERPVQPCKSNQVSSFPSSVQFPNTSDYIEVFVSAIDTPSHFYIQLVRTGDAQKLDQLIDTLTDEASAGSAEDMIDSIEVGAICSAPFVQDDSRYRAKVTQINSDGTVGLYYVDYGDYGTIPKYKLRKIRKEHLQLPFQAIECYLANIRPKDDNWTEQASNDFQDLTYYPNWVGLMAKTVKYCGDIPCLDLYDTTTTQDIYINGEMIKRGFALEDASFPPQPLQPKVGEEKPFVSETEPSTVTNLNKDGAKSAISEATPLTKAELFTVSSPPIDEEDTGKDLDLRVPATPKEFSPIKNALVKRVSKDYIDTLSVAKNTEKKPAIGGIAEENAKPEAMQETLVPAETDSQVESVPEAGFLADVESIPEVESTPEVNIPTEMTESSKLGVDLSTSGSPKLSASQVLKPEVREMIQMEVSQAFETQLPPEGLFTQSLINERTDVDLQSSNEDIPKHQQVESTRSDSGIELTHDEDVKNVESTLSVTVDSHNQPFVTETMVTPPLDKHDDDDDDDDDDDNLETFTPNFTKQVQTKKTFVSSVTVTSNHSKRSTVTLVPSAEKKDGVIESVTSQSSKRSYAQAVRTSQEYDSKDWTGSEGEHLTGSQDPGNHGINVVVQRIEIQSKPDENTVFELQREAKSMTSSTEDGTLTTISSIQQQTCQTSTHVTQSANHKQLPNGQLEMERKEVLKLDRASPVDSDSEAYVSALDELASDTDTTSFYDTAADHISSSTTSLDYLGNDTDTDTLKPHTEDPGTPVNTDSDDDDNDDEYESDDEDESDSGDKTPQRKRSLDDEAVTPTASGSIKLAAKCLSELDLGYRGDSEDVTDSKEDLR